MALLILMQRPKQEGLGAAFGGGVTDQVFGARTTNVLQRGTVYLGSLFFILSMTLAILIGKQAKQKSLLEPEKAVAEKSVDKAEEKAPEVAPPPSLVDQLPAADVPAPAVEVPTAPAVEVPVSPAVEAPASEAPVENAPDKSE
jgi:preprotein translocase subunit SecG